jgi:hypothetical protein
VVGSGKALGYVGVGSIMVQFSKYLSMLFIVVKDGPVDAVRN